MFHIHVAFFSPAGARYISQPCTDQHQGTVSVRKCSDSSCPSFNFAVDSFQHVVCADSGPMLAGEIHKGKSFLYAVINLLRGLAQLHFPEFFRNLPCLFPGCLFTFLCGW